MADAGEILRQREKARFEANYKTWEDQMLSLAESDTAWRKLGGGFVGDLELQPTRWFREAMATIEGGAGGHPLIKHLPQGTFQHGSELFLKGMWLCQYPDCREFSAGDYVAPARREELTRELREMGHDLLRLIEALKTSATYGSDALSLRFLNVLKGVAGTYYLPLVKKADWASGRYPTHFYNDAVAKGVAQLHVSHPQHRVLIRLFSLEDGHLDQRWKLTEALSNKARAYDGNSPSAKVADTPGTSPSVGPSN